MTRVESVALATMVGIDRIVANMPGTWMTSRMIKVLPEAVSSVRVPELVEGTMTQLATVNFLANGLRFHQVGKGARRVR